MKREWKLHFYKTAKGNCPVRDFLDSLDIRERAKAVSWINLLNEHGINLHRPFADLLEDGIHELRMKLSGDQIRVLYFFCYRDYIILTHDFVKTSDKVPKKEIERAKESRTDFLKQHNENNIRRLDHDIL
jgi:phage-related protein